jgi:hypothetical protein
MTRKSNFLPAKMALAISYFDNYQNAVNLLVAFLPIKMQL